MVRLFNVVLAVGILAKGTLAILGQLVALGWVLLWLWVIWGIPVGLAK